MGGGGINSGGNLDHLASDPNRRLLRHRGPFLNRNVRSGALPSVRRPLVYLTTNASREASTLRALDDAPPWEGCCAVAAWNWRCFR